jgi:hypothetical protein
LKLDDDKQTKEVQIWENSFLSRKLNAEEGVVFLEVVTGSRCFSLTQN